MSIFRLVVLALPVLNLAWWWWADRRLRGLSRPAAWRSLLAAFVLAHLGLYAWVLASRFGGLAAMPAAVLTPLYVWYIVVLPATVVLLVGYAVAGGALRGLRMLLYGRGGPDYAAAATSEALTAATPAMQRAPVGDGAADADAGDVADRLTRRQVLAASAVALPPIALGGTCVRALEQLDEFRVRSLDVPLPTLPPALEGLTIAHVSDIHVGKFTRGEVLDRVAECTNQLHPDLVCVTGDLIDFSLADLPEAIRVLRQLTPRFGLFLCEGNHDLFDDRAEFERRVRAAGLDMLINEQASLSLRGVPVQVLGLRWGHPREGRGAQVTANAGRLRPLLAPQAFKILLAHHPHAFDPATEAGIDLTLSGHTHGGQLMLTPGFGPGSFIFKYVSGLYHQAGRALVVSNGVGNWFPLRINAPAEIVFLTLRRGMPDAA